MLFKRLFGSTKRPNDSGNNENTHTTSSKRTIESKDNIATDAIRDEYENTRTDLNEYPIPPPSTPYDIVISINSLAALKTSGWAIALGENARNIDTDTPTSDDARGVIVAIVGSYNRGKTFFINQLCDINLPNGSLIYTEGISMTAGKNQAENIIFVDTAGTDTAIPKDKLSDKKATEALLKEIALHLCSYVIIVVNRLRATDQSYIGQVITHCKSSGSQKNIIIVHNLSDVETKNDIESIVKTEVEDLFEAKIDSLILPTNQSSSKIKFFSSTQDGVGVRHFILAKHGSEAAAMWNRQSIDGIMMILQAPSSLRRHIDIVSEIIDFVNTRLPYIFSTCHKTNDCLDACRRQQLRVQLHETKPCIVLDGRRSMTNLDQEPDELTLVPKALYDDSGFFLGVHGISNGGWRPHFNLYESSSDIHAVIELAGLIKSGFAVNILEDAIIISGNRDDFKKTMLESSICHEQIPAGQFMLEIPLNMDVDPEQAKMEFDNGLCKIICPKKRLTLKVFE